jgi:alginate O-acetyltransferase complex protein AlgI
LPQFLAPSRFSFEKFDRGVFLLLAGLCKKLLIADNLAGFVQGGFLFPQLFTGLDLWLFTYAFAFQIYFDFSGYTDIARGSALLFGYEVPINFNLPYLAGSISEFWRRWHISLSTWLRDYLFIPLGGSRGARLNTWKALMVTMLLGGLWHGAALHFAVWGVYHGFLLVMHREFRALCNRLASLQSFLGTATGHVISVFITFHAVCLGWVIFRADSLVGAHAIFSKMLFLNAISQGADALRLHGLTVNYPPIYRAIYLILPLLFLSQPLANWLRTQDLFHRSPRLLKAACVSTMVIVLFVFSPDTSPQFIYFQF